MAAPIEPTELLPPAVPDEVIDALVLELNTLHRNSTVKFALDVGRTVVEHFWGGEFAPWRSLGRRDASFRKLSSNGKLTLSASDLNRCVQIAELCDRLGVASFQHLGRSHLEVVLPLPAAEQARLVKLAERHDWTVARLEKAAAEVRENLADGEDPKPKPGPRPLPAYIKTLNKWHKMAEDPAEAFGGLDTAKDLDDAERARLLLVLATVRVRCDEAEAALAKPVAG